MLSRTRPRTTISTLPQSPRNNRQRQPALSAGNAEASFRLSLGLAQHSRDLLDEPIGGVYRRARTVERHAHARPEFIIGNILEIIGLRQEASENSPSSDSFLASCENNRCTPRCVLTILPERARMNACAAWKPARYASRPASSPTAAPRIILARARHARALSRCSPVSGVTDQDLRVVSRASGSCDPDRRPPGRA